MVDIRLKNGLNRLKDFLFPGRKRRREQLASLNQQVGELQTELTNIRQHVSDVSQNLTKIGKQVKSGDELTDKTKVQLDTVQRELSDQQSKLATETHRLSQLATESGNHIRQLLEKVAEIEHCKTEQLQLSKQLGQQQLRFSELNNESKVWQDSTAALRSELQRLSGQLVEIQHTIKHEIESFQSVNPSETAATVVDQRVPGIIAETAPALIADQVQSMIPDLCHQVFDSLLQESKVADGIAHQKTNLDRLEQRMSRIENSIEAIAKRQPQPSPNNNSSSEKSGERSEGTAATLPNTKATPNSANPAGLQTRNLAEVKSSFCLRAYECYAEEMAEAQARFIYLDVKSIPRSGLHYLQRTLHEIFENQYSFCEWYQEPGCCKQMPCSLTGFAKNCKQGNLFSLRMVKSHDFDLSDPVFTEKGAIRRIVLIRDPLFSLTSYWNLQALQHNHELLQQHGIGMAKINYLHEKPLLGMAFKLIDSVGTVPNEDSLWKWLESTRAYYLGFIAKWSKHVSRESIIDYQQINDFLIRTFEGMVPSMPVDTRERFKIWADRQQESFQPRNDPFFSDSEKMKEHLNQHADLFRQVAEEIVQADDTGLFANCQEPNIEPQTVRLDQSNPRDFISRAN
jgi:predicted  nucleic acid-binding Zn-ribbon protein